MSSMIDDKFLVSVPAAQGKTKPKAPLRRAPASLLTIALASLCSMAASTAFAAPTGETQACGNCHYQKDGPAFTISLSNDNPDPGEKITIEVKLKVANDEGVRTGAALVTSAGELGLADDGATKIHMEDGDIVGVSHSETRDFDDDGESAFSFAWTAPDQKGVSDIFVFSVAGNGNDKPVDDHASEKILSIAHGCEGKFYYPDQDEDGFGDEKNAQLSCEPVSGFVEVGGDCKDDDADINPDAKEQCNAIDDNCDGEADEGLDPGLYYPDEDGDGYGDGVGRFACKNSFDDYVMERGDCEPDDEDINPGADEIDNGIDDNCNGEIDEEDSGSGGRGGDDGSGGSGGDAGDDDDDDDEGSAGGCQVGSAAGSRPSFELAFVLLGALSLIGFATRRRQHARARRPRGQPLA